jgi:hypothetical protein
VRTLKTLLVVASLLLFGWETFAAENMPKKPFGQEALIPDEHQWIVTPLYQYTEFDNVWIGGRKQDITFPVDHGFDQNDFTIMAEYGFHTNWAVDAMIGFTDLATRAWSTPPGSVRHTRGLSDTTYGLRYQVWNERTAESKWTPTLTLRAGGIYRGTYQKDFPFAPGSGGVGIEVEAMAQKSFGWEGLAGYATAGYRDIRSGANSQLFATVGINQKFRGVTLSAGYRHQQSTTGFDARATGITGNTIVYTSYAKEINEQFEAGIGYTDKHDRHWQFYYQGNFDGRNTGDKDTYGIYVSFPIGGKRGRD